MSAITARIFIDGKWSGAESVFAVRGAATLEEFARCADAGPVQTRNAVDAAARAAGRFSLPDPNRGCFFEPIMLTGLRPSMKITQEETFAVSLFDTVRSATFCGYVTNHVTIEPAEDPPLSIESIGRGIRI